jgi:hypothetical protein
MIVFRKPKCVVLFPWKKKKKILFNEIVLDRIPLIGKNLRFLYPHTLHVCVLPFQILKQVADSNENFAR